MNDDRHRPSAGNVARTLLIVGIVMLVVLGLAVVAGFILVATAMSSYGSNK